MVEAAFSNELAAPVTLALARQLILTGVTRPRTGLPEWGVINVYLRKEFVKIKNNIRYA